MPGSQGFTRTMQTMISNYVRDFLLAEPSVYKWFKENNLIRKIPPGQDRWRYFQEEEVGYSKLTSTIHDYQILSPQFQENDVYLMMFNGKIRISKDQLDKFRSGVFVSGDLMARTVASAVRQQLNQVDQFLVWGDSMLNPGSTIDPIKGQGVFTGILNGGTALGGGIGADNDVTDAGDYVATVAEQYQALQNAAHQSNEYVLISDPDTRLQAFQGNQYLSTTGSTEYARILNDYPWLKQWIATPNCHAYGSETHRMAMIAPKQRDGQGKSVNTIEAIMGYNFEVTPVANGGLTESGNYEAFLQTSIAFVEYWSTAIQRTGDLTIKD